jgi:hypothetical protein
MEYHHHHHHHHHHIAYVTPLFISELFPLRVLINCTVAEYPKAVFLISNDKKQQHGVHANL